MSKNIRSNGFSNDSVCNDAINPCFEDVLALRLSRRDMLKGGLAAAVAAALPGCAGLGGAPTRAGFTPITPSSDDLLRVPPEYEAKPLFRWGDPIGSPAGMPAFRMDAGNSAAEQALQAGMHHDGMQFYPMPYGSNSSTRGLLAMNHEYLDQILLYPDGMKTWSAEKVKKAQHAVGVSVIEIELKDGGWNVVRPSRHARRITAATPCRIAGPAAGATAMRTALDPAGRTVLGTYNGCAHGWTPWGTYLTCEENWNNQFVNTGEQSAEQKRYGISTRSRYRWEEHDARFNAALHPNEPNRFGWVVEIDPYDPDAPPVKRTALGRLKHEGAAPSVGADGRIAFYMGDDEAFEYIYKFVTRRAWNPNDRTASRDSNRDLLDEGALYAARFNADGSGEWLLLEHGVNGLTAANGFADQAEVLVKTRQAADRAGATRMDRPEWCAVNPATREVYCTLTNNSARGADKRPAADAANPRARNIYGHIIRWREAGADPAATRFDWDIFAMGGDPASEEPARRGRFKGDAFGSPDGLYIDTRGMLWVETDISPTALNKGDYARLGNNQMLAVDPVSGEFRRFLTGPAGSEITGLTGTPDGRTFFVNIQHPGEGPVANTPENPRQFSNWPDYDANGRPRSATVAIRRKDGGIVGT